MICYLVIWERSTSSLKGIKPAHHIKSKAPLGAEPVQTQATDTLIRGRGDVFQTVTNQSSEASEDLAEIQKLYAKMLLFYNIER